MKTILVDAVGALVLKDKGLFKEMFHLLEEYPNRKIVLTNANVEKIKELRLNELPYDVFTLQRNPSKTDPQYYKKLLNRFKLSAADVICFEHNEDAVKSARSTGIKTFYYDKEKDLKALKKFINGNI